MFFIIVPLSNAAFAVFYMSLSFLFRVLRYSPISVMQIRVITKNNPGIRSIHQAPVSIALCERDIRLPQEIISVGSPRPIKLNVASIAMALPMFVTIINMMADMKFGIRCFLMI